jgi:hypothetical protein
VNGFDDLRDAFAGQHVCVAGNGPTLSMLQDRIAPRIATVNSGLGYFAETDFKPDLFWVQDLRMMKDKAGMVTPYLDHVPFVLHNAEIAWFAANPQPRFQPVRMLGYTGFSRDIRIGAFHGYNAVYGLLQILAWSRVAHVTLCGVGLNYFASQPRFYQSRRKLDVDLHRASEQVHLMARAITALRCDGIGVDILGPSLLLHANLAKTH